MSCWLLVWPHGRGAWVLGMVVPAAIVARRARPLHAETVGVGALRF